MIYSIIRDQCSRLERGSSEFLTVQYQDSFYCLLLKVLLMLSCLPAHLDWEGSYSLSLISRGGLTLIRVYNIFMYGKRISETSLEFPDSGLLVRGYRLINRESYANQHRASTRLLEYPGRLKVCTWRL